MITKPLLVTERFELWQPRGAGDLEGLYRLTDDEETRRFLGPVPSEKAGIWDRLMRNAGSWSLYGYGPFFVRPRGIDTFIGNIGIFHSWRGLTPSLDDQPEAGWTVRRDWWGKGVAMEVMEAVLPWFEAEHGSQRIVAIIELGNAGSERVAAKLGFRSYSTITEPDGTILDLYERLPSSAVEIEAA